MQGLLFDEVKPEGNGGGGTPDVAALNAKIAELEAKLNAPPKEKPNDTPQDLGDKTRQFQKQKGDEASLESALQFNLTADKFLDENKALLPESVVDMFEVAKKESFDSQVQKAIAIKTGIVQHFFEIQENLDLLTDRQKKEVENYFKLTKNGKEEKVQFIYDNIFEPTLINLKKSKKAEELQLKSKGLHNGTDAEKAYIEKLKKLSRERYLGEKK